MEKCVKTVAVDCSQQQLVAGERSKDAVYRMAMWNQQQQQQQQQPGLESTLASSCLDKDNSSMMSSREHIDNLRAKFESLPSKTPDDQAILLEFDSDDNDQEERQSDATRTGGGRVVRLAQLVIKSGAKNALSGKMISELTERLDELETWSNGADSTSLSATGEHLSTVDSCEARCLLIRGDGGVFCSGSDLITARHTTNQSAASELAELMQYNLGRLARLPLVSVAFVEGYALGGGAELALAADLRVMSGDSKLGFVHAKNGICCGWSGGFRLVQLVGPARALELLASGRLVGADEAQQLGLCERRVESLDDAIKFAKEHAIESGRTSAAIKTLVGLAGHASAERALQVERQLFASTWGKPAHLRALERNVKHGAK